MIDRVNKRGLLWTFKKGSRFGTDQWTISVADIQEKRVKILAQLGGSEITCTGPANLELELLSLKLLVEEVGHDKTRFRIISQQRIVIRPE